MCFNSFLGRSGVTGCTFQLSYGESQPNYSNFVIVIIVVLVVVIVVVVIIVVVVVPSCFTLR